MLLASMRDPVAAAESGELADALAQVGQLQAALDSRVVIEQAKGVLRERFDWSVEDAFEVLRYGARSARMNIHALAEEVVARETTPTPIVVAIARTARWRAARMREYAELQRSRAEQLEAAVRELQERLAWKNHQKLPDGDHRRSGHPRRSDSPPQRDPGA